MLFFVRRKLMKKWVKALCIPSHSKESPWSLLMAFLCPSGPFCLCSSFRIGDQCTSGSKGCHMVCFFSAPGPSVLISALAQFPNSSPSECVHHFYNFRSQKTVFNLRFVLWEKAVTSRLRLLVRSWSDSISESTFFFSFFVLVLFNVLGGSFEMIKDSYTLYSYWARSFSLPRLNTVLSTGQFQCCQQIFQIQGLCRKSWSCLVFISKNFC